MTLLIFETGDGCTVHLPANQLAYWKLSKGGALTLFATGGEPLHAADAPAVLLQLESSGLIPAPSQKQAPAPAKKTYASQKA